MCDCVRVCGCVCVCVCVCVWWAADNSMPSSCRGDSISLLCIVGYYRLAIAVVSCRQCRFLSPNEMAKCICLENQEEDEELDLLVIELEANIKWKTLEELKMERIESLAQNIY